MVFGAIASATAPAATVMVIREYKAKGSFTDMLLAVVAIDDSWCLLIFSFSLALAKSLYLQHSSTFDLLKVLLHSFTDIGGSLILGLAAALALSYLSRLVKTKNNLLIFML